MGNIRERIDEIRELHPLVSTDKGTLIIEGFGGVDETQCFGICLLYTSPSPRDA